MKVFAYVRVSGKGQLDGDGFPRQKAAIQAFCEARGWEVLRTFSEEAVSGTTDFGDRDAFTEMLSLMGGVMPTTFVVECADRLARDLTVSELLLAQVKKLGFSCFSAAGELDLTNSSDPTRILIRQVLGALAEWDKSNLVRKLRAARDRRSDKLGRRVEGAIPFEKRSPKGEETVRSIYEMRERGMTFDEITLWMTRNKVVTPEGKTQWQRSSVHSLYRRFSKRFTTVSPTKVSSPGLRDELSHVLPT